MTDIKFGQETIFAPQNGFTTNLLVLAFSTLFPVSIQYVRSRFTDSFTLISLRFKEIVIRFKEILLFRLTIFLLFRFTILFLTKY